MPKVPEGNPPLYSTSGVPGVQFPFRQEFGKVGEATERLGSTLGQGAVEGADMENRIQQMSDNAAAATAQTNQKVYSDNLTRQLKLSSPDGMVHDPQTGLVITDPETNQPRTIAQEYYDKMDAYYSTAQQGMTDQGAAMYRNRARPDIAGQFSLLQGDALQMQAGAAKSAQDANNQTVWKSFNIAPSDANVGDPAYLNKFSHSLTQANINVGQWGNTQNPDGSTKPGFHNPVEIAAIQTKQNQDYAGAWMDAAIDNIQTQRNDENSALIKGKKGIQQGGMASAMVQNLKQVVLGQDNSSLALKARGQITPSQAMSADQQQRYLKQLNSMGEVATRMDESDLNFHIEQVTKAAQDPDNQREYGVGRPNPAIQQVFTGGLALVNAGQWTPAQFLQKAVTPVLTAQAKGMLGGASFDNMNENAQRNFANHIIGQQMQEAKQYYGMLGPAGQKMFTDDVGESIRTSINDEINSHIQDMARKKQEDLPGFFADFASGSGSKYRDPIIHQGSLQDWSNPQGVEKWGGGQRYVREVLRQNKIAFKGVNSQIKILPQANAEQLSAQLNATTTTGTQTQQMLSSLRRSLGDQGYGLLMHQLTTMPHGLNGAYAGLADQTPQEQVNAITALKLGPDFLKEAAQAHGEKLDAVQGQVDKFLQPSLAMTTSFDPTNATQIKQNFQDRKQAIIGTYYSLRNSNPSMSANDALKTAIGQNNKLFPTTTNVVSYAHDWFGAHFGQNNSNFMTQLPAGMPDQVATTVKQNMLNATSTDQLSRANIAAPDGLSPELQKQFSAQYVHDNISKLMPGVDANGVQGFKVLWKGKNAQGNDDGTEYPLMVRTPNGKLEDYFLPLRPLTVQRQAAPGTQPTSFLQDALPFHNPGGK